MKKNSKNCRQRNCSDQTMMVKRHAKQDLYHPVCKSTRRQTEGALIYFTSAWRKCFEGCLAALQAPSLIYKIRQYSLNNQQTNSPVESPICCGGKSPLRTEVDPTSPEGVQQQSITLHASFQLYNLTVDLGDQPGIQRLFVVGESVAPILYLRPVAIRTQIPAQVKNKPQQA